MLRSLQVRNYVLIDSLDLEFPAGRVIITGPSGAGKSILLGALSMLLGGKADSSMLGSAGGNCVVEAEFDSASDSILEDMVEKAGLDWNGGVLTIRRVLSASGRSRAFVNDEPVNMSVLTELSSRLIDIHSQHQTLILKDKAFQLSLLDHYAGNGSLLSSYTLAWKELQSINARLQELGATLRKMALEKDYNEAQFTQLDQARLQEGELEALEAEQKMLANAGQIKEGLYAVSSMLAPEEGASTDSLLKESVRSLERVGRYVPEASALASRLESVRLETEDILSETQTLGDGIDVSAERLSQVEERMSLLYGLLKKHACSTVA